MPADGPFLYLPIETWVREFHAKTLLAVVAANRGWTVVIGPKSAMSGRLSHLPEGTVFQFGLHGNFAKEMRHLQSVGHKVVAVDEEGLVTLSPEHYKRYRVSADTLEVCDACFCWGDVQFSMLSDVAGENSEKLRVTGNPRMDLLRPELRGLLDVEAEELRKRYGPFILLNGNFGSHNHAMGLDFTWKSIKEKGWMDNPADAEFHRKRVNLQGKIFDAFRAVLPAICRAGHKVVVRPHPSESLEPWMQLRAEIGDGLEVNREGNVLPWLQACEAVLHNGCTTGVEAFALGRPVISFRPAQIPAVEAEFPNQISMQVHSEEELIALLADVSGEEIRSRQAREKFTQNYIAALTGELASARMVDALPVVGAEEISRRIGSLSEMMHRLHISLRQQISPLVYGASRYSDMKCPPLDAATTREAVRRFVDAAELDKAPPVKEIGGGLLQIG